MELTEQLKHCFTSQDDLNSWYTKYKTTEYDLLNFHLYENELFIILNREPPTFKENFEEGFNRDTEQIQNAFYNFHYGQIIREALEFIAEQEVEYGFASVKSKDKEPKKPKTNNNTPLSFKYKDLVTKSPNITDLMNSLISKNLIDQQTELKHFRKVFSGGDIVKKIIWTGSISQLAHFIKHLHNVSEKVKDTKQNQWTITINCFVKPDGSLFDREKLRTQKAPVDAKEIEKTINTL